VTKVNKPEVAENESGAGEIRSKLIARLAVAGVLVAVLLGVLAFFDYLATAPDESEERVFSKPVPVAPKKAVSQPVTAAENLPASPVPQKTEAPVEPPPPPKIETKPDSLVENRPKTTVAAAIPKAAPSSAVVQASEPEATMAPSNILPPQRPVAPAEPAPPKVAGHVVEARPAPGVSRLFSGFLLQAGVFSSVQRAEELHARLTLSGVPSTLETRVQVGPFKTKQEAEAAQAKLKELGVETILVPPKGKN
jgi:DedD protein